MRITLISLITAVVLLSCSKDEEEKLTPIPKLTDSNWVMSGWVLEFEEGGSLVTVDKYQFPELVGLDECILDDTLNFLENRTYQTILGELKCSPEQSIFGNGKWEIVNNTKFSIEPTGYAPYSFTIIELSDTLLSFSRTVVLAKKKSSQRSDQAKEIFSYKH